MTRKSLGGTSLGYDLITIDADGKFRRPDEVSDLAQVLRGSATKIDTVFILIHGWNTDVEGAENSFKRWLRPVSAVCNVPESTRIICVHWPSLVWGDETGAASTNVLGGGGVVGGASAISEYSTLLGIEDEALLQPLIEAAEAGYRRRELTPRLRAAFLRVRDAMDVDDLEGGNSPDLTWDPDAAWADLVQSDDSRLGLEDSVTATNVLGGKGGGFIVGMFRQLSFWRMKKRARIVGERGAAKLLSTVVRALPDAAINLAGHSMGAIVASAAVASSGEISREHPVQSLLLIQGAVSMWAFDAHIEVARGVAGYFSQIIGDQLVRGPIVATYSDHDHAVGTYYPVAARLARSVVLTGEGKYGATGAFGVLGLEPQATDVVLQLGRDAPELQPGVVYNVDASDVIRKERPIEGAHNDLEHEELVRLAIAGANA